MKKTNRYLILSFGIYVKAVLVRYSIKMKKYCLTIKAVVEANNKAEIKTKLQCLVLEDLLKTIRQKKPEIRHIEIIGTIAK